ncbi:chemokine XC receptor 1-like [Sphaeramia orbicularis]|uniref:chemokine XC receptor 1-like n=1 Tax=Sphaeramia orbicularis TaxID=375764 RepID=UPI00117DD7D8|nr:chemokine XC receptor 1-like [Sphaeramia orbicularis]
MTQTTVTSPDTSTDGYTDYYTADYDNYYEDEMCMVTSTTEFGSIFNPVFFSIVVILSLFGNILVIVILVKYENLKSITNTFIFNLAVSDLLFTAGLPFFAYNHMYGWTLGEPACKTVNFVFIVGFYSSGILLILMTIHRYVAVMNPLADIVSTKGFHSVLASVIIWAVSVFAASPAITFTGVQNNEYCEYRNSYWSLWGIYQQNVLFIVSSVVFIFCYSQIMCRLLRPTAQRRKSKTLKLIFTLMIVFFICWAPYNIVIFKKSFNYWPRSSSYEPNTCENYRLLEFALNICRLLAFSHCCLNPVFYVFVGVKFKNHLKRLLKGWSHNNNNNNSIRSRQSRHTIISLTSGEEMSL